MFLYRISGEVIGEGPDLQTIIRKNKNNLRFVNLAGVDLRRFNLDGVDLEGADLSAANLYKADLVEVSFRGANLTGANLHFANVTGADFRYANLNGTGCVSMQCGRWNVWVTPERCWIGCKRYDHDFWLAATLDSVEHLNCEAKQFWTHWGEMIKTACRACAKHGWPEMKNEA